MEEPVIAGWGRLVLLPNNPMVKARLGVSACSNGIMILLPQWRGKLQSHLDICGCFSKTD